MINLEMVEDLPIQVSQFQKQMWFNDQLSESSGQPHWTVLHITGSLNIESLQLAYSDVINRHQILKSAFYIRNSNLIQSVFQCEDWNFDVLDFKKASYSEIRHFMIREARRSFKLQKQPAIRAMLIKSDSSHHYLSVGIHPIAADKTSIQIFWRDLIRSYQIIEDANTFVTSEKGLQFSDIVNEQGAISVMSNTDQAPDSGKRSDFDYAPVNADYNTTAGQKAVYSILNFPIPDEVNLLIEDQCARLGVDSQLYFLTAFKILLSQSTGKSNLVVGYPFNGRNEQQESVIGPFENVVPIASRIDSSKSFLELVGEVSQTLTQALNRVSNPGTDINIQCKFGYEEHLRPNFIKLQDINFQWEVSPMDGSPFDLTFMVRKESYNLNTYVVFRADLFTKAAVSGLLRRFEEVLSFVSTVPEKPVSEWSLQDDYEPTYRPMEVSETASFQSKINLTLG